MLHTFTNNSIATLSADITDSDTVIEAEDEPGAYLFQYLDAGDQAANTFQMGTLTNSATPGVFEIVYINLHNGLDFTLGRGAEGTTALDWPAGTKLSARVTAGMLQSFVQNRGSPMNQSIAIGPGSKIASSDGLAINAQGGVIEHAWVIGGYPALQRALANPGGTGMDRHMSLDLVGGTNVVDLGVPVTWATATAYADGAVVRPTTPNGKQYLMRLANPNGGASTSGTEPSFGSSPSYAATSDPDEVNFWYTMDPTSEIIAEAPAGTRFYPTEVGFICFERGSVSAAPYVNIGTTSSATKYANNVQLTALTADHTRHRIALTDADGVEDLTFTLVTPAVGGTVRGRFYFKGMLVEVE